MSVPPESPAVATASAGQDGLEAAVMRKVTLRLIPFLFLLYVVNILDRANIGFAKLKMMEDLNLSGEAYGFGAGIFYSGYILFEVPSNLLLARTGARVWIARILMTWGVISSAMMFVVGPWSFYALRILLGIAEAGFFPGIILYLSHWFPAHQRARAVAKFMIASLVSTMIGNPVSGIILRYADGLAGLHGWQWVFLIEGIPAVLLGVLTLYFLTDRPEEARWLTAEERDWLQRRLEEDRKHSLPHDHTLRGALGNPLVWLLIGVYMTVALGDNAIGFYLPTFLQSKFPSWNEAQLGGLAGLPALLTIGVMIAVGVHSDRTNERRWHVAGSAFVAATGWALGAWTNSPWLFFAAMVLTVGGMKCMLPTFWAIPTAFLRGTGAAGGIALINALGNVGGMLGPIVMSNSEGPAGNFATGMLIMAGALVVGGCLCLMVPRNRADAPWA